MSGGGLAPWCMRLGLVPYLNARPLDYGFRARAPMDAQLQLLEASPSRLCQDLLSGKLDAALISSVECLRNRDRLRYCRAVGVCARDRVESILYFRRRPKRFSDAVAGKVFVDDASRTSIALLELLLKRAFGKVPIFEKRPASTIAPGLGPDDAGLLIGDPALRFAASADIDEYEIRDLAGWWHETEGLPFVFALWAFAPDLDLPDAFFLDSLQMGEEHISEIANQSGLGDAKRYLTETLHYRLDEDDHAALQRFHDALQAEELL
ncbi:MAG: menaquinone biosynthesis protein [Leptospiraceae bacterium]|nr:menaquinone biosynthesis protein [Leptospiraceae bacterium]